MKSTLAELLAFATIADTGSMTKAAERLLLSTPVISRILRRLENKLDATLIRRTTRRLELTEEGAIFLEQARSIIESVEFVEAQIALRREVPAGLLRVSAAGPFMQHLIVPLITDFHAAYPGIEIELSTSNEIVDLTEERTDVAIQVGELRDSSVHARRLGSSRLRILASPSYLTEHGEPERVADLSMHAQLGFSQTETLNHWPLCHSRGDSFLIKPVLRASNDETLLALAVAGAGIVCLADYMTNAFRARNELVEILADSTADCYQPVYAIYFRNTKLSSWMTRFLDCVSSQLRKCDQIEQKEHVTRSQLTLMARGRSGAVPISAP